MSDLDAARAQASIQVQHIAQLCDFLSHPATRLALDQIPVTMPRDFGALGFVPALWVGFGVVGLWAALDAFGERHPAPRVAKCALCNKRCIAARFGKFAPNQELTSLRELEDLRHLYAHNFAGQADQKYFAPSHPRHVLRQGVAAQLSCDATFDGSVVVLREWDLRYYANAVQSVLERVC